MQLDRVEELLGQLQSSLADGGGALSGELLPELESRVATLIALLGQRPEDMAAWERLRALAADCEQAAGLLADEARRTSAELARTRRALHAMRSFAEGARALRGHEHAITDLQG